MPSSERELISYIVSLTKTKKVIDANSKLFSEDFVDSIQVLDLIAYIEKQSGRKLTDQEIVLDNFATPDIINRKFLQ